MIVHPTPNPQEVPPTILQHSYTKGTPFPHPQPTGGTTHHLTTLIHPQYYNTHTLKGPPASHPLTHRKYHPPSYNTHTLKGPPASTPTSNPQEVPPTILQHSYTKGTPCPPPLPPTHRKYHPPSYNTHTLKGPPTLTSYPQPTGTTTHHLTTLIHPQSYNTHTLKGPPSPYPQPTGSTTHHLTTLIHPQSCNTHTLKGPTASHPLPPTHREYHPHSNNTHTLKGPPYPHPTGSTTHNLTKLMN